MPAAVGVSVRERPRALGWALIGLWKVWPPEHEATDGDPLVPEPLDVLVVTVCEVGGYDAGLSRRSRCAVELWSSRVESPGERCNDLSVPLVLPPDSPCSFCAYLIGQRPYTILYRDVLSAILVTWEQRGLGHVLVIPIAHRATVIDLDATERSALMDGVVSASNAIIGAYDPDGVAVWQNNGLPANQTVPHTHFHVAGTVPGGGTVWGDVERLSIDETDKIAARLEPHLSLLD